MKKIRALFCLLVLILFYACAYGADRYFYVTKTTDESMFYIDTQTIRYVNGNVIKYWDKEDVSAFGRKKIISELNDKKLKKVFERLSEIKSCIEFNIGQNIARIVEIFYYDTRGYVIHSTKNPQNFGNWSHVPPGSILESERNALLYLLNRNSSTPSYTPAPPQSQPPMRTPNDQKEYQQLQEYFQWLSHQPDYPEFDRWFSQKLVTLGVTPQDINSYLMGYINGGGRYVDIQGMIAGWYREFYQERYGGRQK